MRAVGPSPAEHDPVFAPLAVAWAGPLQMLVVGLWLAVPHPDDAHGLWVVAIAALAIPLHVPLLLWRPPRFSRAAFNIGAALATLQVAGLVWAGGGFGSGFSLMVLWTVPVLVAALPRTDVVGQLAWMI